MANSFANLVANLNLNIQNFSSNLRRASSQADQFASNLRGQINGGLVEPAKESKFAFKDVARIVQGILISKAFYGGLNAIRNCTNAVWEFSQELEYAKIAYSNLFGDTALAQEFINVLEDFAATTPFSFSESEAAAKRLLAYGIQYKNVMYVMQGVLAASSMQNNPQVIESVSRAIGQIYTKGRLMNEEMRQLAEAGIPAYEILAEKLGLTQEQLQNLGKQAIPASTAINALVEGMTERFGGVVQASTTTMKGIISNIKDNATMIASGIFEPMYNGIKSVLAEFGQFLFTIREIYATTGVGGVFEAIFPKELHGTLRQVIANVMNLIMAVGRLVASLGGVLKPIIEALLRVFNAFAPVLIIVANFLSALINLITSNATAMKVLTATIAAAAAMWVIFKVKALAATVVAGAIKLISAALKGLSVMLSFVMAHPFWALILVLGGALVGLSGGFDKLSESISGTFKKLTSIGGVDPDKLLLPSQEERVSDLNKFNQALEGTSDSMDDLAGSTGKATKAAKGLLSFDEVFKLRDPDEGTDSGIEAPSIEIPEIILPDFGDIDIGDLDFEGFAEDLVTGFVKAFKEKIAGAGLGAVIGGALGSILGGPLGLKIGAIAGAVAGWFWEDLAKALNLTNVGTISLPIATGLGSAIGALVGGPLGAAIGAGIGAFVGWFIDSIASGIENGDWSGVVTPLSMAIYSVIGLAVGGPGGALIGAAIGALLGDIGTQFVDGISKGEWNPQRLGTELGTSIGAAIGMIFGGPAGAAIGAAIGALVGWLGGLIVDKWDVISQWFVDLGKSFGDWLNGVGTAYDDWRVRTETAINTWCDNTWNAFTTWVSDTGNALITWVNDIGTAYDEWRVNTETAINTWCDNTWNAFTTWVSDTGKSFITWVNDTGAAYDEWRVRTETAINTWCDNTWNAFTNWVASVGTSIGKGLSSIWTNIMSWISNLWTNLWSELTDIGSNISNWWSNLWSGKSASVSVSAEGTATRYGHAYGGVFNKEHVARFAEGNKSEAIIPLETESAMQPFVDAVSNGLTASLMPLVANISGGQQLQPLYVGTLIADERSLRELERKMQIIRMQETKRRG